MLPKELRLLSHEVSSTQKQGTILSKDGISFYFVPSTYVSSKFSIIVTKKASKKAVVRNNIKRLTRLFLLTQSKKIQHPLLIVIVIRSFHANNNDVFLSNLTWLFNKLP